MGLVRSKKSSRRKERVEPRLYASRHGSHAPEAARRKPKRHRSILGRLVRFGFVLALWGMIGLAGLFGYIWFSLDQKGLLKIPDREPGVMLLAADGSVLAEQGSFYGDEARINELPDYVPNAVIAIEDRRFRSHFGVDPLGLARAMYVNYRSGHLVQGGSTITQQLAKNLFLNPERTIQRKLQEAVLAVWLENKFTKNEILQLYLNRVYYGSGATGIAKAAKTFYHKSASELTLTEAATLAGVLKAPSNYSPITRPEASAERARLVIASMVNAGFISADEAKAAEVAPASVKASDYVPAKQYIVDWVNEQLPELVKNYDQSIVIETTIDPALQTVAEKSLRKRLIAEGTKRSVSQGALVMLDGAGAIRAMVGGRSYKGSQFNRVTRARRQPGSAFKPFVYLAALEQGYSPESVEVDEPVRIGSWTPENYGHKYRGAVTLEQALALSLNTVAAKLASQVGPRNVVDVAHRLGITSKLGTDASIALGTSEVTLLELTSAFTPFSNGGFPVVPYAVRRISTRDGRVLYERSGTGFAKAVSDFNLGAMNRMMRAVVSYGTAKKAQIDGFDIAGKTGTSQDYRDAWFIGYTNDLVAGVWLGNDDNSPTKRVTGGSLPAEIWKDVMTQALAGMTPQPLPGEADLFAGAPSTISEVRLETDNRDLEPQVAPSQQSKRKKSFLESLFGLGSDEPSPETRPGGRLTAAERRKRAQQEH